MQSPTTSLATRHRLPLPDRRAPGRLVGAARRLSRPAWLPARLRSRGPAQPALLLRGATTRRARGSPSRPLAPPGSTTHTSSGPTDCGCLPASTAAGSRSPIRPGPTLPPGRPSRSMAGASAAESGNDDDRIQASNPEPAGFDRLDQGSDIRRWQELAFNQPRRHRRTPLDRGSAHHPVRDQGLSSIPRLA
jgi:hypothetical protein